MADPFSILASGVGIADVAVRVIGYLKDVKAAAETVEDDIDSLISEVEALRVVHGIPFEAKAELLILIPNFSLEHNNLD